ncbi:MAG: hypothetical protein Q4C65_00430 [Eubacteriales bacterium]|nr:hypothetical protein [Eubacteriales bacterium]
MRFREETLAKIFTYITVIVLLGIVAFEAWTLQRERWRRKETEAQNASQQESLQELKQINRDLKEENAELAAFRNKWSVYASSLDNSEVLALRSDLFMRTDLIPEKAIQEIRERMEEEEESVYTFDNPNGDNIFLPVSANMGDGENCLIYTAAYETGGSHVIELLYEVLLDEEEGIAHRDENGEVEWTCVAYQTGEGWRAAESGETQR